MPNARPCPQVAELQKFLLGLLAAAEAERMQRHVAECQSCLDTLHGLESSDTLVEAMRAQVRAAERSEDAIVAGLIAKLDGLDPLAAQQVATVDDPIRQRPGATIGPYRLAEEIGEGGFGIVFRAEQQEPLRRQVALKIVKPGMDTRRVIARFEAERQALALMDHVNIAKVLDAGTVDEGVRGQESGVSNAGALAGLTPDCRLLTPGSRPYFVMELVRGVPITAYCDEHRLPIRERLSLFLSVCQAIQHAHTKGIIHRDIKPSNVLTAEQDGKPLVKVIDFGIAKALGPPLADQTQITGLAQMIGTPLYMSPEQAGHSGVDIDTRTDIFSLGVLLYELLTGTTPIEKQRFKQAPPDEIRRILREEEPERPSVRLARIRRVGSAHQPSAASGGHSPPYAPAQRLAELDWIVMKCLEKDRSRRYETASGLALDVQRYLADEPVLACPPSAGYRLGKFARRNKAALSGAAVIAAGLLTAAVALAISNVRVNKALTEKSGALTERTKALTERTSALQERTTALSAETLAKNSLKTALDREKDTVYEQKIALADRELLDGNAQRTLEILDSCPMAQREWEWHYLQRRCQSRGFLFAAALGAARLDWIAKLGTTRNRVAICTRKGLHVLDSESGSTRQSSALFKLSDEFRAGDGVLAFLQDGKQLAWCPRTKLVIWDIDAAQPLREIPFEEPHWLQAIDNAGSRFVTYSKNGGTILRDGQGGQPVCQFADFPKGAAAIFGSNARLVLADGRSVSVHDAQTGNKLSAFQHFCDISALDYHAPQKAVVIGDVLGNVSRWGEDGRLIKMVSHGPRAVYSVAISPDDNGRWVAWLGRGDAAVKVADWAPQVIYQSGEQRYNEVQVLRGRSDDPAVLPLFRDLAFQGHNDLFGVATDGSIRHWNLEAGQQYRILPIHQSLSLVFSGDGRFQIVGNELRAARGRQVPAFRLPFTNSNQDMACLTDVSADGKCVLSVHNLTNKQGNRPVKVWEVATSQCLLTLEDPRLGDIRLKPDGRWPVRISPDGRSLALAPRDGSLSTMDIKSGREEPLRPAAEKEKLADIAFSPDGRRLADAGARFQVWDLRKRKILFSATGKAPFASPVFTADSLDVACICGEGVTIWDASSGQVRQKLPVGRGTTAIAFSPDGRRLASLAFEDGRLRLWDTRTGRILLTLQALSRMHFEVAFSPDGNQLITQGQLGTWVWDGTPVQIEMLWDLSNRTQDAKAWYQRGFAMWLLNDLPASIDACREAIRLDPQFAPAHHRLGVALKAQGDLDEAIAAYRAAIRLDPKVAASHSGLGDALRAKLSFGEAIAAYREAIRLEPKNAWPHDGLGSALQAQGDLEGAIAAFSAAIDLDPNYGEVSSRPRRFEIYVALGNHDLAVADYAKGIDLTRGDVYQIGLAWMLATCADAKRRDPGRAVELAKAVVKYAYTPNASYLRTLGVAQYRAGDWKAAITALEEGNRIRKAAGGPDCFFLAMAHWQLGDEEQAHVWYDRAVEWMDKNQPQNEELCRFRAEATDLLRGD